MPWHMLLQRGNKVKVADGQQMNKMDELAQTIMKIPGIILMENAAGAVVREIEKEFEDTKIYQTLIFIGTGNNGGDGLAVGRHLFNRGSKVQIILLGDKRKISGDAKTNMDIIEAMGVPFIEIEPDSLIDDAIACLVAGSDVIVDGIFGTGFTGIVPEYISEIMNLINYYGKKIIAIDLPSGVDAKTGEIRGNAIKAHKTVTFAVPKCGLILYPGTEYTGKMVIADIGIPREVVEECKLHVNTLEKREAASWLPQRPLRSNKGTYGTVQVVAGSTGMTGAASLACTAAYKSGTGLVRLAVPKSVNNVLEVKLTEVITLQLPEKDGKVCEKSSEVLQGYLNKEDVMVIGPGIGQGETITTFMTKILEYAKIPLVIDADALNAIAKDTCLLKKIKVPAILTPHPGEMSRLTGISIQEILKNPIDIVREFCAKWNVITVLKDARTVIGHPGGDIYINTTGNAGMATAGSGDVLSGVIAALIAQKVEPYHAAVLGVYLHGRAGDLAAQEIGQFGLMASDLCTYLPLAFKEISKV